MSKAGADAARLRRKGRDSSANDGTSRRYELAGKVSDMASKIVLPKDLPKQSPTEGDPTFPLRHRIFRGAWAVTWALLCSWTPPSLWRWRRFWLRCYGATIGSPCDVRGTANIWYPPNLVMEDWTMIADGAICYNVGCITIQKGALVSQRAHLCAASHNVYHPDFALVPGPIVIKGQSWIAAEAFVGPGVTVGEGSVLGARAAAFSDLEDWTIYRGNPATRLRSRPRQPMMQVSQRRQTDKE